MGRTSEGKSLQHGETQLEGAEKLHAKNKYTAPKLVEYGSFAKLTQGGSVGAEMNGGTPCL